MNRSSCRRPPTCSRRARQRGSIAIIVGLSLAVMVGFAGLALDLGRLYVNKTELQSAADACALAASRELACDTSAGGVCPAQFLLNAETAGIFAAAKNMKDMQGSAVTVAASDVRFNTAIGPNSGYLSRADGANVNSKFVMCLARSKGLVPWFMGAMDVKLGKPNEVISAAVATLAPSRNFCVGAPIGVCRKAGAGAPDYGYAVGEWIKSQFTSAGSDDVVSGDFKWVDFTPNAGGNTEIRDGLLGSDGVCNVKINDALDVVQQGQQQGAKSAYNTRFGIYPNGANAYTPADAPPDRTGYAYPNKSPGSPVIGIDVSAYTDYRAKQAAFSPFIDNQYGVSGSGGNIPGAPISSALHEATGANRRLINVPAIDCAATTASILGMVCVLMLNPMSNGATGTLYLEYRGASNSAASPCAAFGAPGGPGSNGPMVPTLVQ
jgi:Flp pilus assembly protein TadG